MKIKKIIMVFMCISASLFVAAQDIDLDKMLDEEIQKKNQSETQYTEATFKATRLINGQSIETTQKGILNLVISHRFGMLNQGLYNLFGLDNASMRFGFDYGLTDRFSAGVGRSTFGKQYDGYLKYKLLWQSAGKTNMPISLTLLSSAMYQTDTTSLKSEINISTTPRSSDKMSYAFQAIFARKFSPGFSLQVMPTLVHYNIVPLATDKNDLISIGSGARLKISKRVSINGEYYYQLPNTKFEDTYNSFSLGVDIETGGHVFQMHFTNSTGMTERTFITKTTGNWGDGGIHFGFNVNRAFTVKKPKTLKTQ
jgi:Membrane bound beta barrel domain (DUF5777)